MRCGLGWVWKVMGCVGLALCDVVIGSGLGSNHWCAAHDTTTLCRVRGDVVGDVDAKQDVLGLTAWATLGA